MRSQTTHFSFYKGSRLVLGKLFNWDFTGAWPHPSQSRLLLIEMKFKYRYHGTSLHYFKYMLHKNYKAGEASSHEFTFQAGIFRAIIKRYRTASRKKRPLANLHNLRLLPL